MPKICHYCGGKRYIEQIGTETCFKCKGTGRDLNSDLFSEPCNRCNGKGKTFYNKRADCTVCNGKGYL